jgi:hypothetical protein
MRDLKRVWEDIREIQAGLPGGDVWVVAVDAVSAPVEVGNANAARLLHAKSHRLATDDEVRSHHEFETESNRRRAEDRLRREGVAIVTI